MVSRHELPLLDSEIRDFLLAFAHRVPILLTYDANRMLYLDVDPIEAITKVCDELCLLMKESHFNVTAEHREGLLRFLECCVTEIRDVYPEEVHPEAFLPMNGCAEAWAATPEKVTVNSRRPSHTCSARSIA